MNRDVTYKDSLLFHISTMKILCPVFGIIMLILGFIEAKDSVIKGGNIARIAKEQLEKETGKKIIWRRKYK